MPTSLMLVTNIIDDLLWHTLPHVVACENTCARAPEKVSSANIDLCAYFFTLGGRRVCWW